MKNPSLTGQQLEDARDVFNIFDLTSKGCLNSRELKAALRALGFDVHKNHINLLLEDFSISKSYSDSPRKMLQSASASVINFEIFCNIIISLLYNHNMSGISSFCGPRGFAKSLDTEKLRNMFTLLDVEGTGRIGLRSLKTMMNDLSLQASSLGINIGSILDKHHQNRGHRNALFSDEELRLMIEEADGDMDGYIDFNDFHKIIKLSSAESWDSSDDEFN